MITALLEGDRMDAFIQGAYSLPVIVREQTIIDAMEIEPQCEGRCRTITWGTVPIHLVEATEVVSGCSIRVRVTNPRSQLPICPEQEEPHFEDIALFQASISVSKTCGIYKSGGNSTQGEGTQFAFDTRTAEFRPGAWNIRAQPEHIQDLYAQWSQRVFAWEGEVAASHVMTWFVDHRNDIHCYQGRLIALYEDFEDWERRIKQTWQDRLDSSVELEFNIVTPLPPRIEYNVAAHVVLVQAPHEMWVTSLVSALDPTIYGPEPRRAAITTNEHIVVEHLLVACNYDPVCLNPWSQVHCQAWYDRIQMQPGMPLPGRSGYSIELHVQRQFIVFTPVQTVQQDETSHLQTAIVGHKKTVLSLEQSLDFESAPVVPISLIDEAVNADFPDQVFLPDPIQADDIERELALLGWKRHVYLLQGTGFAFCVPEDWKCDAQKACCVYYPVGSCDRKDIILHCDAMIQHDVKHMSLLHALGFCRAVVLHSQTVRTGLTLVQYHNNEPALEVASDKTRQRTPWPACMPTIHHQKKIVDPQEDSEIPSQRLELGIQLKDLQEFFQSGTDVLCPWHSHLDMPEVSRHAIDGLASSESQSFSLESFDRLIVYTDGSSKPHNRRKPPLWVQDHDVPDAWAFLALGEKYTHDPAQPNITFLGWHAQCVTYEEQLTHFLGTNQIGSEHSEREALFWASLWRLSINSNIPTVFRSDSVTTTGQSLGIAGCNDEHPTFGLLRSVFQALQAALPPECLDVQHVRGHAGDPWNELAGYLAKTEACIGHKLKRQAVNLHHWKPVLPYLWMLFDKQAGLPRFLGSCFDVRPPTLPELTTAECSQPKHRTSRHHMALSLATCNVGSLFTSPEGYGGKLTYLRQQMKELQINILGIQEARSPAGASSAEDVVRLASGCDQGRFGVELWINTSQPIAYNGPRPCYIQKSHVQVVHADPRRLLVRLAHPCIDCHICVLHAPQSGRPFQERRDWWAETNQILHVHTGSVSLYVLIDANAKTGRSCEAIVFDKDDHCSANTEFLREFLQERGLCLPCTSHIHQGADHTWTAPDGQTQHRIDFVAIPTTELSFCTHSCVVEHFDIGNSHEDHRASALQLQWTQDRVIRYHSKAQIGRVDRNAIIEKRNLLDLQTVCASPWHEDVETHVQSFNTAMHSALQAACPMHKQGKKKYYLTHEAWTLRSAKLHLRRRLQNARRQSSLDTLRLVLWAWKHQDDSQEHRCQTIAQHAAYVNTTLCITLHLNCRYLRPGWMTKASGVGERRKGRGELRRDCHHRVAALFVPTRMQQ